MCCAVLAGGLQPVGVDLRVLKAPGTSDAELA